jgi:NAD-dependent SIR2 family protein deacetylase
MVHIAPVTPLRAPQVPGVDDALRVLSGRTFAVLTGAGISTDSGIPDYRGEGAPKNHPMSLNEFLSSEERRKRYWMGSHLGWQAFHAAQPNLGHMAVAQMERDGIANGVITQNVDGLHHEAGSLRVVDLHGRLDKVRCLQCGQSFARGAIAAKIERDNPAFSEIVNPSQVMPDGDVKVSSDIDFTIPQCDLCSGMLKPEVVFFGEFVPTSVFQMAAQMVDRAEALVVAGSSLVVNTGMRLVAQAQKRKKPVIVINRGPTKADQLATVRIEAGTSEALVAMSEAVRVSVA